MACIDTNALQCGVQVYLDEADKPDTGLGLNKEARVTLHKVHRMDKATNRPTTDPDTIARFERRLKKLAADQNARFISYDPEPGTWVFEVDHFSRCAVSYPCKISAGYHPMQQSLTYSTLYVGFLHVGKGPVTTDIIGHPGVWEQHAGLCSMHIKGAIKALLMSVLECAGMV